jgi:hypothetical protein
MVKPLTALAHSGSAGVATGPRDKPAPPCCTGHVRPQPQACRPACPPYASAPLPEIRGRLVLGACEAITPQRFRAAAHVILVDAHPARLTARPGHDLGKSAGSGLARTLSVIVRGFTRPSPRAHGHMADRACREDHCQAHMRRSGGI